MKKIAALTLLTTLLFTFVVGCDDDEEDKSSEETVYELEGTMWERISLVDGETTTEYPDTLNGKVHREFVYFSEGTQKIYHITGSGDSESKYYSTTGDGAYELDGSTIAFTGWDAEYEIDGDSMTYYTSNNYYVATFSASTEDPAEFTTVSVLPWEMEASAEIDGE